ncbi:MAG TPA: hypothetical protein VFM05_03595, partial [Candidatus Saccharimonadales bacterium]|nr:hypothetical protein [Candidatus Saccharimonadales bacterium]
MQDKLFRSVPTATLLRTPRKLPPKTPLEKYVLENLPAQIRLHSNDKLPLEDIAASQQQLLSSEGARIKAISDLSAAREVQLDLVMMLGVYLLLRDRAFTVAPPILLELLETNAGRHAITKRMTYELIVDVNTEAFLRTNGQIRIFSYGDIGLIERDFYIGHHFAEKHIKDAYEMLREVVQEPGLPNKTERLQAVLTGLQEFTKYMAIFAHLKPDAYAYFRRFLVPYPDKVKNGSGAFMPSPQLFEMLLHKPGYAQTQHVTTNEQYFSQWAQPLLHSQREAAEGGQT